MSIEHLQMVIGLLQSMGAEGKDLFIWWLALTKGAEVFFGAVWSAIGAYVIYKVFNLIGRAVDAELAEKRASKQLNKLLAAAGVSSCFNQSELEIAEEVLREHYPRR